MPSLESALGTLAAGPDEPTPVVPDLQQQQQQQQHVLISKPTSSEDAHRPATGPALLSAPPAAASGTGQIRGPGSDALTPDAPGQRGGEGYSPAGAGRSAASTVWSGEPTPPSGVVGQQDTLPTFPSPSPTPSTQRVWWEKTHARLGDQIGTDDAIVPLAWQALLTGLVDSTMYASTSVWVGFITGDFVQFSMGVAQYIISPSGSSPHTQRDGLRMLLRGVAICGFFVGSWIAGRLGKGRYHARSWLIASAIGQSICLWVAAGIQFSRSKWDPVNWHWWPPTVLLASTSMGLQSTTAQKLSNPVRLVLLCSPAFFFFLGGGEPKWSALTRLVCWLWIIRGRALAGQKAFATSVAFTATVTQIAADPHLLTLWPAFGRAVRGRDLRILSLGALCVGAGVGQSLLQTSIGFPAVLAVCAGAKLALALLWWVPPGEADTHCGRERASRGAAAGGSVPGDAAPARG